MADGQEAVVERTRGRRRRRRLAWLLGILTVAGLAALVYLRWDRCPGSRGTTVVSLRSLANSGPMYVRIWPGDQPRSVRFVAIGQSGPMFAGTAGASGVIAKPVMLPAEAQTWEATRGWHGEALAYLDEADGAVYLRSPYWAPPRKLTDTALPLGDPPVTWAPAGNRLAVAVGTGKRILKAVRVFSADGAMLADVPLPSLGGRVLWTETVWSPSGRRLLVRLVADPAPNGTEPPHALLLSEPDWRPVSLRFRKRLPQPLAWADEEVLVGQTWPGGVLDIPPLQFVRLSDGKDVGRFDCGEVRLGGPRVVCHHPEIRPAPSRAGVVVALAGASAAAQILSKGFARVWGQPSSGLPPAWLGRAHDWTWSHPPQRVAYVYVSVSGKQWRTLAVHEAGPGGGGFAVSADGTELLYMSNWELKAAPLPPEARSDAKKGRPPAGH